MHNLKEGPSVALRIHSGTLSAAQISNRLEATPTESQDIGAAVSSRAAHRRLRTETLWLYENKCHSNCDLQDCIEKSIRFLEDRRHLIEEIRNEINIDLFCGCWIDVDKPAMAIAFSSELIQRLAALRLDVLIDVIPNGQP